jgi:transcriptional regulator with XRE-family HTH domain
MSARELVAINLRRIRVEKGISQEALAVDASIDRTYVSRLERASENPTVDVLERLADALDCKIPDFFRPAKFGRSTVGTLPRGRKPTKKHS